MKRYKSFLFYFLSSCLFNSLNAQNIQVNDTYSAQDLVQNVLVNSACASVSNFSVSGGNFLGGNKSYGYFTAGTSGFPFANGIVLSTSRAISTQGPNDTILSEDATSWYGDFDLQTALGISNTINATVLEFDFIPLSNKISFDYLFASEEYHGVAQCNYSDGFAFLIRPVGSTAAYQNLALIPGTQTPVKVTTIHPATSGCGAINEQYFGTYNDVIAPINFNGQTKVMTAQADVVPNTSYHMKIVIADEGNAFYDSAIFLGGGSFTIKTDLGVDRLVATNNAICSGTTYTLSVPNVTGNTYKWYKNNQLLVGETNSTLQVQNAGDYKVEIFLNGTTCMTTDSIIIEYYSQPSANTLSLYQCDDDNDGISTFNLTKLDATISGSTITPSGVKYYESLVNAQNQTSEISNPTQYKNLTNNTIFARYTNSNGCVFYTQINLLISNNTVTPPNSIVVCDEDSNYNGITSFDLNSLATTQLLLGLPSGMIVSYFETINNTILETNPLSNTYSNTTPFLQTIYAKIINGSDCYDIVPIVLKVNVFNPTGFEDENIYLCNSNPIQIGVASTFSNYLWSTTETTNSIIVSTVGSYSVEVMNADGCKRTKTFHLIKSEPATITSININDFSGNENSILINYSGSGDYEFSLDGTNFQSSPLFTNVFSGQYQVTINDVNGCGTITSSSFYVLDYPRFFTPNGDGYNDYWKIPYLESQSNAILYIYDRYGTLLKKLTKNDTSWDGKFNGALLPSDDYWFYLTLDNVKIIRSHFALKR